MNKRNYQVELEKILVEVEKEDVKKKLLIHSCCAPCSSYVLEYLSNYFEIHIYFYNPNITNDKEYHIRLEELKEYIQEVTYKNKVKLIESDYEVRDFFTKIKGLEDEPERGKRCVKCFELRLEETAKAAKKLGYDYFTTALTISPMKDSNIINNIGEELGKLYDVNYLIGDFKKKNGYKRSIAISKEKNLYRQDYCGCIFSKKEREKKQEEKNEAN